MAIFEELSLIVGGANLSVNKSAPTNFKKLFVFFTIRLS
jgi:hypothetical protein